MANSRTSWNSVMAKFTPAGKSAQLHPDSAGCPRPDLAIKCATHSGSKVGRKIWDRVWPRPIPLGFHAFSQARFPAIPNPPMRRRVYGEVCGHGSAQSPVLAEQNCPGGHSIVLLHASSMNRATQKV